MSTPTDSDVIDGVRITHRWTDYDGSVAYSDLEKFGIDLVGGAPVLVSTPVVELSINGGPLNGGDAVILDDPWLAKHLVRAVLDVFPWSQS